jgi:hypothetical protein
VRNRIAALEAADGSARAWNPDADGAVRSLIVTGSTVYAGGEFASIAGQPRNGIAALGVVAGQATAWNPDANAPVYALAAAGNSVFAGGNFSIIGGQSRSCLAALDAGTGAATAWDPAPNGFGISALVAVGSTIYAGGSFVGIGGQPQSYLAALSTYTVDAPVGPPPGALALASPAPSVVSTSTRIRFTLPEEGYVSLEIYDLTGRRVAAPFDHARQHAGPNEVVLDVRGWPPGCYWCRLTTAGAGLTRKMVVFR